MERTRLAGLIVVLLLVAGVIFLKISHKPTTSELVAPAVPVPTLLELGSTECSACKRMAPIIEDLKTQLQGKVTIRFIDVFADPAQADRYGIQAIPTQVFYDAQGKEVARHVGFLSKEKILAQLKQLGIAVE